jgi:hypothetical protein
MWQEFTFNMRGYKLITYINLGQIFRGCFSHNKFGQHFTKVEKPNRRVQKPFSQILLGH